MDRDGNFRSRSRLRQNGKSLPSPFGRGAGGEGGRGVMRDFNFSSPRPLARNPPVRFDQREVETEHVMQLLRHSREDPDPDYAAAYPTAPSLDSIRN